MKEAGARLIILHAMHWNSLHNSVIAQGMEVGDRGRHGKEANINSASLVQMHSTSADKLLMT